MVYSKMSSQLATGIIYAVGSRIAHGDGERIHAAEASWTVVVAMGRATFVNQDNASTMKHATMESALYGKFR